MPHRAWAIIGAFAALSGCASTPTPRAPAESPVATVLLQDEELSTLVSIESQRTVNDPSTGALLAATVMTNRSLQMLRIEARTLFKDATGTTVETSPWRPFYLDPAATVTHTAPTLHSGAVRFITQLRLQPPTP